MCVIELYVMAANKLYMQWPPMCAINLLVMAANKLYICNGLLYMRWVQIYQLPQICNG